MKRDVILSTDISYGSGHTSMWKNTTRPQKTNGPSKYCSPDFWGSLSALSSPIHDADLCTVHTMLSGIYVRLDARAQRGCAYMCV